MLIPPVAAQPDVLRHPGGVRGKRNGRSGLTQLWGLLDYLGGDATLTQQKRPA